MTSAFRPRTMTQLLPIALLRELCVELFVWRVTLQSDYSTLNATVVTAFKVAVYDGGEPAIRDGMVAHYGRMRSQDEEPFIEFYRYEACSVDARCRARLYLSPDVSVSYYSILVE